jgi:hypothetical protein
VQRIFGVIGMGTGALVAILGCGKSGPPDGNRTPEPFVVIRVPVLDQDTDLDAFRKQFGNPKKGHTRFRLAAAPAPCTDNCGTAVTITAYSGAKEVNPTAGPTQTVAIAHVSNAGPWKTQEGLYAKTPPLDVSTDAEYEIVMDNSGPNHEAKWTLLRVPNAPRGKLSAVGSGKMYVCQGHTPKNESEADFSDCSRIHPLDSGAVSTAGFSLFEVPKWFLTKLAGLFTPADVEPVWVSCSMGCCTLGV